MRQTLSLRTCRLLDIPGFDTVDLQGLASVAPWLRLAFGGCALLADRSVGGVRGAHAHPRLLPLKPSAWPLLHFAFAALVPEVPHAGHYHSQVILLTIFN